jgi:hypothetical protein
MPRRVVDYRSPAIRKPSRQGSRAIAGLLGIWFLVPFAIILPLMALGVKLGQGYFEVRYSPIREFRTPRMFAAAVVIAAACGGVWWLAAGDRGRRRAGLALLAVGMVLAGVWVWWAPPSPINQQFFNARSFSTDGAFALEGERLGAIAPYLRNFGEVLRKSPADLGGTRILSNPPGMTIIGYALHRVFPPRADGIIERMLMDHYGADRADALVFAPAMRFSIALTVVWVLAGGMAYGLGRVFLSPAGAAVFAVIVIFNPCTVHFVPGKDPGQLLTINAMLWAWFAGWKRRSHPLTALAGALLVTGATFGLVHIWVALIALCATTWESSRSGRDELRRGLGAVAPHMISAALGAAAIIVMVYIAIGWNIPATLLGVSSRWGELQKTFDMNRAIWFVIGLPIFLLFLSPGIWTLLGMRLRRRRMSVGTRLAICTVAVMLLIYFVVGVTYELPRLWVAFLPTLVLGLAIDSPLLRGRGRHPRVAWALVLIVLVQMSFTAFHWTLFDAREAEYRLVSKRFFN